MQAWVDAYHDMHPSSVENLPIKGGALQGGLAIDYPAGVGGHRFETLDIMYDGVNGQLPNLDLINTMILIAQNQIGIRCRIQKSTDDDSYSNRLETVVRGMVGQGVGRPTGPHSSFMPYHVHAITLKTAGNGWHDEISFGKVVESGFRSINNLLEHLHQSFFFYILIDNERFVSIATYLPSAMLIAMSFSLTCIVLWWESGQPDPPTNPASTKTPAKQSSLEKQTEDEKMEVIQQDGMVAVVPEKMLHPVERNLFAPIALLGAAYFFGLCTFFIFDATNEHVSLSFHLYPTPCRFLN